MHGTAMILGGGPFQLGIIRRASELGLRTLVADISSDAPGKTIADLFFQIDKDDKYGLLDIARHHQVNNVLANMGVNLPRYAQVSTLAKVRQAGREWGYPLLLKRHSPRSR